MKTPLLSPRLPLVALILCIVLPGLLSAQPASPDVPPEKAKQFLELLNDPEVKAWLEGKVPAAPAQLDQSISAEISAWESAVRQRVDAVAAAIPRVPEELARAAAVVSRDVNSGRPGLVIGILAVLIAVGFGAEWLVRRGLERARGEGPVAAPDTDGGQVILLEIVALLAFSLASVGFFLAFQWPPLLHKIVIAFLLAFIVFRAVRLVTRFLVASGVGGTPDQPAPRLSSDAVAGFWLRRISIVAAFLLFGWAVASLMPVLGFSNEAAELAAFTFGLGIVATAVEAVWRRPGKPVSMVGRSLLTLFLMALWVAWVAGMLGLLWVGIYALLLPPLVRSVGDAVQVFTNRAQRTGAFGVLLNVVFVRGARALVIAAAVLWLEYVFRFSTTAAAAGTAGTFVVNGLLNAIVILLVADLLWQIAKALIEHRLGVAAQGGGSAEEVARASRLRTLLPIFRNVLAAFIGAVTALTILAGMGVHIAPLIAGAGIFGVAIGFGSQTLVKDILSGVFYMLDDAFRVGEYIQSGSYKGTVESFSLRSVRLRHHRGPVFTVPFGELGAVQNMSRDWAIEKMTIGVTYDSDVELARKLVKKIGQELAKDPEFAADIIEPLKMQGIDNFGDFAIELKMKMMTKPGTQFPIKRRAYMMIKKAFAENGIKIAFPTVHVEGGSESAAAAQQVVKMKQAAEQAATQAANEA